VDRPDALAQDADLIEAARRGDGDALETLILRYQPRVFRFGLKMCRNVEDAGDIVQETLLALARKIGDFRGDASVSTWLFAIARNACIRRRRRSKFAPAREESLEHLDAGLREGIADPSTGPERAVFGHEIEQRLADAIDTLEPGQREVLVLRDVEGLSATEVAEVLGIQVDAVKSRLHRARLIVRARLAPALGAPPASAPATGCPDVLALFSRHLEGDIAADVCREMEAHLAQCRNCLAACDSLRRSIALCQAAPPGPVPEAVANAVRASVSAALADMRRGAPSAS
jgi:RNA polymerase sigma-70 factor, ECF subfamily